MKSIKDATREEKLVALRELQGFKLVTCSGWDGENHDEPWEQWGWERCDEFKMELPELDYNAIYPVIHIQKSYIIEGTRQYLRYFFNQDSITATPSQLLDALLVATGKFASNTKMKE